MKTDMKERFTTISISRLVLQLGIPAMFAQFFNILYSITDRIFVGHITGVSELALASVGVCAPALTAVGAFASLIGIGGASVMSFSIGRGEQKTAEQTIGTSLVLLLFVSLFLTVILYLTRKPLLYRLGCSDAMYPYAVAYFETYVLGTVAALCGVGMNQFILAQGFARQGMFSVMVGAIMNTILDPLLIFGLHLGIRGAAIATVISQFCVMAYVLFFLLYGKHGLALRMDGLHPDLIKRVLTIGCLPFFIMLFDNLLMILLNGALRKYGASMGDRYISCAAVVQSFMILAFYPAQGITTGCGTLYSYHYGAGNYRKILQVFRSVLLLCGGYMALLLLASQTVPEIYARLFVQDVHTIPLAAACIRKYAAGLLGVAIQYALVDGLTTMGQMRYAMPISFLRKGLYVLCVLTLPLFFPVEELFWSATISDCVGAVVTLLCFLFFILPKLKKEMVQ
ncbi:MAG: MATE family efflux transporter [Lachnospiraceae bacterium]|nr:MATE family efflux transporter [Lachnospiraceae bacterium]